MQFKGAAGEGAEAGAGAMLYMKYMQQNRAAEIAALWRQKTHLRAIGMWCQRGIGERAAGGVTCHS